MSAEMPKIPEPVYIFWSADTLHIRLWTADPERAARFAADTGATATVYVPKQEVQEATRQAMERGISVIQALRDSHCADTQSGEAVCMPDTITCDFVVAWNDAIEELRALIPHDPDHLAGVGDMVEAPTSGNGEE